jgi:GTP cyclohydrolase IIa
VIQLTLIQIDNYGPWTTTPLPKKEAYLQTLQSWLYHALQKEFSAYKALVLPMRYDNLIAITNGMSERAHQTILNAVNKKFPVSVSMSVAVGKTPYEAQKKATRQLSAHGGAQQKDRKAVFVSSGTSRDAVCIAHFDIDRITIQTDTDVYDSYRLIIETELALIKHLTPRGALVFFMGGDNFISPCGIISKEELCAIIKKIEKETGIGLKAGIGAGPNPEEAVYRASLGLKQIRRARERVVVKNGNLQK